MVLSPVCTLLAWHGMYASLHIHRVALASALPDTRQGYICRAQPAPHTGQEETEQKRLNRHKKREEKEENTRLKQIRKEEKEEKKRDKLRRKEEKKKDKQKKKEVAGVHTCAYNIRLP